MFERADIVNRTMKELANLGESNNWTLEEEANIIFGAVDDGYRAGLEAAAKVCDNFRYSDVSEAIAARIRALA